MTAAPQPGQVVVPPSMLWTLPVSTYRSPFTEAGASRAAERGRRRCAGRLCAGLDGFVSLPQTSRKVQATGRTLGGVRHGAQKWVTGYTSTAGLSVRTTIDARGLAASGALRPRPLVCVASTTRYENNEPDRRYGLRPRPLSDSGNMGGTDREHHHHHRRLQGTQ